MAGHSKWANIKHRKGKADAAKGKAFTKVTKEIINAVKQGGPDLKSNPKLRLALQKAKEVNLPNDNIERNIKKAMSKDQDSYIEMTYELYGHGGVGILVEVMTDNKNRIASDMRIATNKRGGNIATPGAVAFNFDKKGVIQVPKSSIHEEDLFNKISEAEAEDLDQVEDFYIVITAPEDLYKVKESLENQGVETLSVRHEMFAKNFVSCDQAAQEANFALIDWLESLDDVDEVYHNMELEKE